MKKIKTAVLVSGAGTNLQALINAAAEKDFPAKIILVISNIRTAKALDRAKAAGITSKIIDHQQYQNRENFDEAIETAIRNFDCEIICLAGFLRILTTKFVERWQGKILNIHPSLLPSFPGVRVQEQVLDSGVKITGCTVHFVTPKVDSGPILVQSAVPVLDGDDANTLAARVLKQEHLIYPIGLRLMAQAQINGKNIFSKIVTQPVYNLDSLINPGLIEF